MRIVLDVGDPSLIERLGRAISRLGKGLSGGVPHLLELGLCEVEI
jgi:hypothetical protein